MASILNFGLLNLGMLFGLGLGALVAAEPVTIGSGRTVLRFAADGRPQSFRDKDQELINEREPGAGLELKGFDFLGRRPTSFPFKDLAFDGQKLTASIGRDIRVTFAVTAADRYLAFRLVRVEGVPKSNLLWLQFRLQTQGNVSCTNWRITPPSWTSGGSTCTPTPGAGNTGRSSSASCTSIPRPSPPARRTSRNSPAMRGKGIGLTIHTVSCAIANEDPDYLVGKIDDRLAKWTTGVLAQPVSATDRTIAFRPVPGAELPMNIDRPVTGPAHVDPWNSIRTMRLGNELIRIGSFADTDHKMWLLKDCQSGQFQTTADAHVADTAASGLIRPYDRASPLAAVSATWASAVVLNCPRWQSLSGRPPGPCRRTNRCG